jgi:hypothetical protein
MIARLHRLAVWLCWIAGAFLVLLSVHLSARNRELVLRIEGIHRSIGLSVGAVAPPLVGMGRGGQSITVDSKGEELPVLVMVFSPRCPVVAENWSNWKTLISAQRGHGGRIVAIDVTGSSDPEYLASRGIEAIPVLLWVTPETALAYGFRFTPQTLVVRGGTVLGGWTGLLDESSVSNALGLLSGTEQIFLEPFPDWFDSRGGG